MTPENRSPHAIAATLGERLKQARLNANLTQIEVAEQAGLSRKAVINAEKGKAQLETFAAVLVALNLDDQLDHFLAPVDISPLQLAKLRGRKRQRASRQSASDTPEASEW